MAAWSALLLLFRTVIKSWSRSDGSFYPFYALAGLDALKGPPLWGFDRHRLGYLDISN
jgi:hypothetical protein